MDFDLPAQYYTGPDSTPAKLLTYLLECVRYEPRPFCGSVMRGIETQASKVLHMPSIADRCGMLGTMVWTDQRDQTSLLHQKTADKYTATSLFCTVYRFHSLFKLYSTAACETLTISLICRSYLVNPSKATR